MVERQPLWFTDEAPRIGSGLRLVHVKTRGWKWVHLEYYPGGPDSDKVRAKLKKSMFELIERDTEKQIGSWHPYYFTEQYDDDYDEHLGCASYPNCDEGGFGCRVRHGANAEMYGHKD